MSTAAVPAPHIAAPLAGQHALGPQDSVDATTGFTRGVHGESYSTVGNGVYGVAHASTGPTRGVYGASVSTEGKGVYGKAAATTGPAHGVYGETASPQGRGVYGINTGGGVGVYAEGTNALIAESTTPNYAAIFGRNSSTSGTGAGVYGTSNSSDGYGVQGVSPNWGVYGQTSSTSGRGVFGYAGSTTGSCSGVFGQTASSGGRGVQGLATQTSGTNYGVHGQTLSSLGVGVYGRGLLTGVQGEASSSTGSPYGVVGKATSTTASGSPAGVYGLINSTVGSAVYGVAQSGSGENYAVYGLNYSPSGIAVFGNAVGVSGNACGVRGVSSATGGIGVRGWATRTTGTVFGVLGEAQSPSGYGVYYSGGLAGSGTKSCVVKTSRGPTLMYCQESPENWFEDFGEGQLVNGKCHIELDPLFLETVTIDEANPMKVFVTPDDPSCKGVAVVRGMTGFDVVELQNGTGNSRFAYRVVAKRKGFETKRLDYCAAAEQDSYLYPELREKLMKELQEQAARDEEALLSRQRFMSDPLPAQETEPHLPIVPTVAD